MVTYDNDDDGDLSFNFMFYFIKALYENCINFDNY